ncbi:hypothetical protein IJD44_04890 [bacterium]|nr:hypothetical protein [bacterium]
MNKVIDFLKNNKFNFTIIALYFIVAIFTMFHHELWRDEAQVWCIVRDMDFTQIFQTARVEGHPFLWYLILTPFAKLGADVLTMQIISLLLVFVAIIIFVFKAPCNNFLKTFVVFSSGLLYYMPIISRNYCLIPIFIFLAASLFQKRKENPILYSIIIVFLTNTHILTLGFCLILSLIFAIDLTKEKLDKTKIVAIFLLLANFTFLFLCFYNMQNVNYATTMYAQSPKDITTAIVFFAQIFFLFPLSMLPDWFSVPLFYILTFLTLGFYFKNDKKIFLILLCALGFQWFIYYKIWYIGIVYQKSFLLMLVILFCYWIYTEGNDKKSKLLTSLTMIFFILSFISAPFNIMLEKDYQYSGSKQLADYIRKNHNNEKEFNVWGYPFCFSSISAYLPDKKLYMINKEYYITYYSFDTDKKAQKMPKSDSQYYITVANYTIGQDYDKIFQSDPNIINLTEYNEIFSIYKKK